MTHVRASGLFCFACILATGSVGPRAPEDDTHMSCVARLEMPDYPAIAQSARIELGVTAAVLLGPDGAAQSISYDSESAFKDWRRIFGAAVEKAVKASKFAASCGGSTVKLAFDFRIPSSADVSTTRIAFGYPNRFEVSTGAGRVNADAR